MIKKALFTCLAIFGLYTFIIVLYPQISSSQHQWQDNTIKAEKYIYNEGKAFDNVIIGTSLSSRLIMDSLPGFYNLSFGGQGIFDGLKIIKKNKNLPKCIYIETNVLLIDENNEFFNNLYSTIPYFLKIYFKSLRSDKQPIANTINWIKALNLSTKNKIKSILSISDKNNQTNKLSNKQDLKDTIILNKMLALQIANYSIAPNKTHLNKQLSDLSKYVYYFKKQGVEICFFEMPIHPALQNLALSTTIRDSLFKCFPLQTYKYIMPDSTIYETKDGIHLSNNEALRYTLYFKNKLVEKKSNI